MLRNSKGFTLIELMIVVVIIGILAAIAIPNFISMQDRAKEGSVKANMHTVQLAIEDFAVQNDGTYPLAADDAAVMANLPGGVYPNNPFDTSVAMVMNWGIAPAAEGDVGSAPAATIAGYNLRGAGKGGALLSLQLSNGS
jgi:type IV pilus assembly protein PilA